MSELLPCPFCGGEAEICRHALVSWVRCKKCGVDTPAALPQDEQLAIDFWNTRAERTCSVVCIIDGLIMDEPNSIELSCGHTFETWDEVPPNYCPNCGAKVVGE